MNDKELAELLNRYLAGLCTEKEKWIIDRWYADIENVSMISQEKDQVHHEHVIWDRIQLQTGPQPILKVNPKNNVFDRWYMHIAAVCACVACFILYRQHVGVENRFGGIYQSGNAQMIQVTNDGANPKRVKLDDGSSVVIYEGGRITYPSPFKKHVREVYLEGEAYFDVARNEQKPFFVYTEDISTKVLGTSFKIGPGLKDRKDIEVAVLSGKVMVQYNDVKSSETAITLTQNQKAVYKYQNKNFELGIIQTPQLIVHDRADAKVESFIFKGTPLLDVLQCIENAYGIHIELKNTHLLDCPFTADLSEEQLYTKLDIIGASVGAEYMVDGNQILFSGGRCE